MRARVTDRGMLASPTAHPGVPRADVPPPSPAAASDSPPQHHSLFFFPRMSRCQWKNSMGWCY